MIQQNTIFEILSYRDFYDIPRLMLASGQDEYWVLDCKFDDGIDEYSEEFDVYCFGQDIDAARGAFELASISEEGRKVGHIRVIDLDFGESRRQQFSYRPRN